ncbi:MAG: 2-phospho-L-lactate guanylyltransferase, partial [Kiloniellales bacterium]
MTTWAVVPLKRFADAKRRLAGVLDPESRRQLSTAMLRDVLAALTATPGLDRIVLATSEPGVAGFGCPVIDDGGGDLNVAIARAAAALKAAGAERMLVLPADVPLVTTPEIARVLAAGEAAPVVIVPDQRGLGTNALLLSPPAAMNPCFGPDSRARHAAAARNLGLASTELRLPGLGFDVDEPEDLARLARGAADRAAY